MRKHFAAFCLVIFGIAARSQDGSILMSRKLLHSTARIEAVRPGGVLSTGTGFMYDFPSSRSNVIVPVLVTCWHVVSNSQMGRFIISQVASNGASSADNKVSLLFPGESVWLRHPDTNIDLAVLPIAGFLEQFRSNHVQLNIKMIPASFVANSNDMESFGVFQELKFIGYPLGIWDEKNNLPIVRRGMTATDPAVDYNGQTKFLLDAAVFPGSSGSPVYMADEGGGFSRGHFHTADDLKLVGILTEVYRYNSEGQLEIVSIPTAFDAKVHTQIPANLGVVIKATRLNDFEGIIAERLKAEAQIAGKDTESK